MFPMTKPSTSGKANSDCFQVMSISAAYEANFQILKGFVDMNSELICRRISVRRSELFDVLLAHNSMCSEHVPLTFGGDASTEQTRSAIAAA